jgi:hypothetical protein
MKNTLLVSAITGLINCTAMGQVMPVAAGKPAVKVCTASADKKGSSCYLTKYSENYKVCKNSNGYFICSGPDGTPNYTYPSFTERGVKPYDAPVHQYEAVPVAQDRQQTKDDLSAPQSQSYPENTNTVAGIGKLYSGKNYIKVCNQAYSVADENRLPYQGCPSPQDDGPDKNNARNINESNPINQPPLTGNPVGR